MGKNKWSQENRAYFEFIDDLKKSSKKDSPTAEVSRMYKEVADILAEAFDEFNPEDLPKYQDRMEGIVSLQKNEPALSDPLFKEDLLKAKSLLDQKVKERFGAIQKIQKLASGTLRTLGGFSTHVRDFLSIGDDAAAAGRRVNNISLGSWKRRLDPEEERRQHDILKGNDSQSSIPQTGGPTGISGAGNLSGTKQILPVKDDTLIGTNTQQNRVLIQLFNVSKDSNQDIKQIKNLLIADLKNRDESQDDQSLDSLEKNQEARASATRKGKGLFEAAAGVSASRDSENSPNTKPDSNTKDNQSSNSGTDTATTVAATLGIEKALEWLWSKKGAAVEGAKNVASKAMQYGSRALAAAPEIATTVASSPVALSIAGAGVGYYGAKAVFEPNAKRISQGIQSITATIGSKLQGVDYYKKVMQDTSLFDDIESQERTEQWTLELLEKTAKEKRERFQKAFKDGSQYGDGSYQKDRKPLSMDDAAADVQAAEEQAKSYKEYLQARKNTGKSLGPLAKFSVDGKQYQNPLFSDEEYSQLTSAQISPDILSSQAIHQRLGKQLERSMSASDPEKDSPFGGSIKSVATDDVDQMMRMIAAAETGAVTEENDTKDARRAIRTKGGADSSAYGPYQITYSLAEKALQKGFFKGDEALQNWVRERFVTQGKKMINSSYSDPKYGAGGTGDLNNPADMAMYEKMSRILVADNMARNDGNALEVLGEHRFGSGGKHGLLSRDPAYARKALHQMKRDQMRMAENKHPAPSVAPAPQSNRQVALNELSKEYDASKSAPVIVQVPSPAPTPMPSQGQSTVSTKSVGASPNGASESSLMLALRATVSPF